MTDPATLAIRLPPGRHLIAVAGAPASGKSHYAERLAHDIAAMGRPAQVVPMDGFHLDNAILDARGDRDRKGAPFTFDLRGFARMLADMREGGSVIYPLFDRSRDIAVAGAAELAAETELVVVEGNYLLYDAPGWRDLAPLWSLSVRLEVPEATLSARLMQRWRQHGLDSETAFARMRGNDLPNAREIAMHCLPATVTVNLDPAGPAKR